MFWRSPSKEIARDGDQDLIAKIQAASEHDEDDDQAVDHQGKMGRTNWAE